jgi:hypothetical protein
MRLVRLVLVALALAAAAHAAPAPTRRPETQRQPVNLTGWLYDPALAVGAPSLITRQSDYEAVARAFGVTQPPPVDFRTQLLVVHVWGGDGDARLEIDARGGLRCVGAAVRRVDQLGRGRLLACKLELVGLRYLIKSFPRSAVKTVNGVAVPGR